MGNEADIGRDVVREQEVLPRPAGRPTGYVLYPQDAPVLLADDSSSVASRAEFARKHLSVTQYDPAEQFAAGDFVHQNPGGDGVARYVQGDRPLDGEDIVLWHTFGPTHFPRPEDWPVMPVDYAKFMLKPYGFFPRNPALNVPASAGACCTVGAWRPGRAVDVVAALAMVAAMLDGVLAPRVLHDHAGAVGATWQLVLGGLTLGYLVLTVVMVRDGLRHRGRLLPLVETSSMGVAVAVMAVAMA